MAEHQDFTTCLPKKHRDDLQLQLDAFILSQNNLRPICVVSSGGTAADLEIRAVRCLDNFSTGLRGAISVEEFLKRGYAVIHLTRTGSAAPFSRTLSQHLNLKQSNHGLNVDSLAKLFLYGDDDDDEDDIVQTVLDNDPWMTGDTTTDTTIPVETKKSDTIRLHRGIQYNTAIQKAIVERKTAMRENRLLTVEFRTLDDYLGMLQLIAEALHDTSSLSMFYLAAAVSDFYIPMELRSTHKIQSGGGLSLELQPVPKVLWNLRKQWAPHAFCVSFKLETDPTILRKKAQGAVSKYGVHMVIGNLLQTRHDSVSILCPDTFDTKQPKTASSWSMKELHRANNGLLDNLESSIVDFVVQAHFEFISYHYNGYGAEAARQTQKRLQKKNDQIKRKLLLTKVQSIGLNVAGIVLAWWISASINSALRGRLERSR